VCVTFRFCCPIRIEAKFRNFSLDDKYLVNFHCSIKFFFTGTSNGASTSNGVNGHSVNDSNGHGSHSSAVNGEQSGNGSTNHYEEKEEGANGSEEKASSSSTEEKNNIDRRMSNEEEVHFSTICLD
jgi:hypothetical protein